jgi:excisionase family DNA binding protein
MSPGAVEVATNMAGSIPGGFATVPEGAKIVKLAEPTIRRYLTTKKLRRYKIGGRTLIKVADLLGLIKEVK